MICEANGFTHLRIAVTSAASSPDPPIKRATTSFVGWSPTTAVLALLPSCGGFPMMPLYWCRSARQSAAIRSAFLREIRADGLERRWAVHQHLTIGGLPGSLALKSTTTPAILAHRTITSDVGRPAPRHHLVQSPVATARGSRKRRVQSLQLGSALTPATCSIATRPGSRSLRPRRPSMSMGSLRNQTNPSEDHRGSCSWHDNSGCAITGLMMAALVIIS